MTASFFINIIINAIDKSLRLLLNKGRGHYYLNTN